MATDVTAAVNLQSSGDGKGCDNRRRRIFGEEANPVIKALRRNSIEVTAVHMLIEFRGKRRRAKAQQGAARGVDKTASAKSGLSRCGPKRDVIYRPFSRCPLALGSTCAIAVRHQSGNDRHAGSSPGRNKDADDALCSTPACPHTCVHAVVLRLTARKILWHDRRAMLRGHGELRQTSCLGLLWQGPALNRCAVLRLATFFRVPVVRLPSCYQTYNARAENKECAGTEQTGLRRNRHANK